MAEVMLNEWNAVVVDGDSAAVGGDGAWGEDSADWVVAGKVLGVLALC